MKVKHLTAVLMLALMVMMSQAAYAENASVQPKESGHSARTILMYVCGSDLETEADPTSGCSMMTKTAAMTTAVWSSRRTCLFRTTPYICMIRIIRMLTETRRARSAMSTTRSGKPGAPTPRRTRDTESVHQLRS